MRNLILADTLTAKAKEMITKMALNNTTIDGINAAEVVFDEVVGLMRNNIAECENTIDAMELIARYKGCISKYDIIDALAKALDAEAYENCSFRHGEAAITLDLVEANEYIVEILNYKLQEEEERFEADVFPSEYNYFREFTYQSCLNNIEIIDRITNSFDDIIKEAII